MSNALLGTFFERKVGAKLTLTIDAVDTSVRMRWKAVHVSAQILYADDESSHKLIIGAYITAKTLPSEPGEKPEVIGEGTVAMDATDFGRLEEFWSSALKGVGLGGIRQRYIEQCQYRS